jgi:hypothetical protein
VVSKLRKGDAVGHQRQVEYASFEIAQGTCEMRYKIAVTGSRLLRGPLADA